MIDDNINKKGEIILCKGIKLDKNYENVLSYSEANMVTLCDTNKIYRGSNYSFMETGKTLNVEVPYKDAMYCNYIAFKNPKFGNKWIFGFVTNVELISPKVTAITWDLDVWSTWYEDFTVGQAFIEREHVSDDTIGKHTIPEGLETGEFIVNTSEEFGNNVLNSTRIAMAYTGNPQSLFPSYTSGKQYTRLYSGYNFMIFGSSQDAEDMIKGFASDGALESIYALFLIPTGLIRNSVHWYNGPNASESDIIAVGRGSDLYYPMFALVPSDPSASYSEITMQSNTNVNINATINGYTPKNNKLFTGDYNYLYITNNSGSDVKINYEDFIDNQPIFKISGAISIGCSIKLIPQNYKKFDTTNTTNSLYVYGLNASKYPTLGWTGDAFTNWLTQNAVNLTTGFIGSGLSVIGGVATGNYTATAVGVMDIANKLAEIEKRKKVSETGQGNINAGDLTYSSSKMSFTIYKMSVKQEMAIVIDSYFSRFGYKVNEVKQPNLNSRQQFNFIKVGGMDELVHGNIPASDLEKINDICRKGVTIFHNYTNFGNYTISNPIVTP